MLSLWGCSGGNSQRSGSTESTTTSEPDWWYNPASDKTDFLGFGQSKKQNPSLAQKVATQRARQNVSDQVKSQVTSEIRDFMSESGIGESAQAIEFSENTTTNVSNNSMSGSTPDKYFKAKDGTVYIRVSFPKDAVDKALLNSAKREEALYNEFKATQAFDRLEKKVSGN